jgi:hypothetical protein
VGINGSSLDQRILVDLFTEILIPMKKFFVIITAIGALFSCGEAGVGFDAGGVFTIPNINVSIPLPAAAFEIDPDATGFEYKLSDVDGLENALEEINDSSDPSIFIKSITYGITGIDPDETFDLDELSLVFNLTNGQTRTVPIIRPSENFSLQNVQDQPVNLVDETGEDITSILESELLDKQRLNATVIFDLGTVPASNFSRTVDFTFEPTFDVLIRLRDINVDIQ